VQLDLEEVADLVGELVRFVDYDQVAFGCLENT
jgi:hypothetical protein